MILARSIGSFVRLGTMVAAITAAAAPALSQSYEFCLKVDDYLKLYGIDAPSTPCVDWPEPAPADAKIALCKEGQGWQLKLSGPAAPAGTTFAIAAVRVRGALPIVFSSEIQGAEEIGVHIYTLIDLELGAGEPRFEVIKVISPRCKDAELLSAADVLSREVWIEGPQAKRDK